MQDLPPTGSVEDVFPARLVAHLHLREFEGTLRLTLGEAVKVLYFKKGEIASAASNAEPDRLANILIREGRLTSEQLDLARSRLLPASSLGKSLIDMGFLTPNELLQGARHQVQVIVASCFAATSGSYAMVPGPLPAEVTSLGINTKRLLFDSVLNLADRATIIREIGSMEAVYRPTDRLDSVLASLKLDFETDRIARLLNGEASLRDVSGLTARDDFTVGKVILALDLLGASERATEHEGTSPAAEPGRSIPIEVVAPLADIASSMAATDAQDPGEPAAPGISISMVESFEEEEAEPSSPIEQAPPRVFDGMPIALSIADEPPDDMVMGEPPPIPQEDLPAFARPVEPGAGGEAPASLMGSESQAGSESRPGSEARWEIDPVTGERVHLGPIEMTFDGRIAPAGGASANLRRLLLGAGAAALVVSGALGYVILRSPAGAGARSASSALPAPGPAASPAAPAASPAASAPSSDNRPTPKETAAVPMAPREPPGTITRAPEPAAVPSSTPAPPVAAPSRPSSTPAASVAAPSRPPEPRPAPAAPVPEPSRPPEPRPAPTARSAPPRPEGTASADDPIFAAAQTRIDQGETADAARRFASWIGTQSGRFTLQLMIACQEDTVKSARARASSGAPLFVLPYSLKGRDCYRVCWGAFPDAESARAAAAAIPPTLLGSSPPPVVPVSRLHAAD